MLPMLPGVAWRRPLPRLYTPCRAGVVDQPPQGDETFPSREPDSVAYPCLHDCPHNAAIVDMQEFHRQLAFDGIWLDMNECGQLHMLKQSLQHGWPDA